MAIFRGRLLLVGDPTSLPADLTVELERIVVASGSVTIGDWSRSEVGFESRGDGVLIHAEGEDLVFLSNDRRLARSLGLTHHSVLAPRILEADLSSSVGTGRARAKHLKESPTDPHGDDHETLYPLPQQANGRAV